MCASKPANRKEKNQGMNWIAKPTRLAIYMRDGMACVYCGRGIESDVKLTLDHLVPHSHGGDNSPSNLVTCCNFCNSSRGNRSVEDFATGVAGYINHGVTAEDILKHIETCTSRPLDRKAAKEMIDRRGSWSNVFNSK